MMHLL